MSYGFDHSQLSTEREREIQRFPWQHPGLHLCGYLRKQNSTSSRGEGRGWATTGKQ